MYFPYLRGKQFELIALREFSAEVPESNSIIPIIEPVKSSFNGLNIAVKTMFENGLKFALVLNPSDGDFKRETKDIITEIPLLKIQHDKWIPAFIYQNNEQSIITTIQERALTHVMLIFKDGIDAGNDGILDFLKTTEIEYIVNGNSNSRIVMRRLNNLGKNIIRLDSWFKEQPRNVDYLPITEDKFTEEHKFFQEDHFYGLSDYTTLPKDFKDSGMLPYAIAIHLTYEKTKEEIYVRHFVSDTNDDQSNIQRKFFEAATKAKMFFIDKERTNAINDLISLLDNDKYPGLGIIKKLSIRNHIELMNRILSK